MTDDNIALRALLEKGSDTTFLREMIGFAAQRLMELETEGLCGAGHGEGGVHFCLPPLDIVTLGQLTTVSLCSRG